MKSLQDLRFVPKPSFPLQIPTSKLSLPFFSTPKPPHKTQPLTTAASPLKTTSTSTHLQNLLLVLTPLSLPLPSPLAAAAETAQFSSDKINIESVLISIDNFFTRYPFFVAGCTFIWLVVVPLTQEYVKKCKFISAIDAFRKLRDLPNSQLLDIRKQRSVNYLGSPSLKVLNKSVVQAEFVEGDEEGFVKELRTRFADPGNTVICVLDNFDGNSLTAAELLFKNGFKEAYAIKGGLRGKDGWQAIQETMLPPSVHVYPRKKKNKPSIKFEKKRDSIDEKNGNGKAPSSLSLKQEVNRNTENGCVKPMRTTPEAKLTDGTPLSPFPNYPDLKPPSSPTPSKPQS